MVRRLILAPLMLAGSVPAAVGAAAPARPNIVLIPCRRPGLPQPGGAAREVEARLGGSRKKWELYDQESDRTETRDLAAEQPERVAAMAALWEAWAKRAEVAEDRY